MKSKKVTLFFIALCTVIYIWTWQTAPQFDEPIRNPLVEIALTSPPIKRALLYDWPKNFDTLDRMENKYGSEALIHPDFLPLSGKLEYIRMMKSPIWLGIYPYLINRDIPFDSSTLFYQIREGEVWRLITPAFLHHDFFHIFFNMLWLLLLGGVIERVLRTWQYVFLILVAALLTNTAQYLMTGPNFLGYSGILTTYLGFIWMRQKMAPTEGYLLDKSVLIFLAIFIFGMFGLSFLSFISERFYGTPLAPGIANTAHVVGIFTGVFLARLPLFNARLESSVNKKA